MDKTIQVLSNKVSRRKFIAGVGAGVGATAAVAMAAGCSSSNSNPVNPVTPVSPTTPALTDSDYLNFALNLEYLEAEFYLNAATGSGLSSADALSGAGAVTGGGMMVPTTGVPAGYLATAFSSYLNEVAQDELNHVRALQATITSLKGTPVARPAIDLTFFGPLAVAAKIYTSAQPAYTPFDSIPDFLIGSFIFEDVGVTAYAGAAPAVTSTAVLSAAAGIQAVEAYHASIVRTLIVAADYANGNTTYQGIANLVSTLRASLGGGAETSLSSTTIVAASSSNAVGYARTPAQVLNIVYGQSGTGITSGGFFPSGVTGNIKST